MITLYTGASRLLNLSSPLNLLPTPAQAAALREPSLSETPGTAYGVGAEGNAMLVPNDSRGQMSAPFRFAALEEQRTGAPSENLPHRKASVAIAGAVALLSAQGCCYRRSEETGEYGLTLGGWFALGGAIPVMLAVAALAGMRLKMHIARRRTAQAERSGIHAIESDIAGWSKLDGRAQLAAVRQWLMLPTEYNDEVAYALESVAWEPNTWYRPIAEMLMGVSAHSKEDLVLSSVPHYLPHLENTSKATIALSSWLRQGKPFRLLFIAALKSMSMEEQDRWISLHKSPLLLSFLRMRVPEVYQRFRARVLSASVAEIDEEIAVMIPGILKFGCLEAHTGPRGGPERFVEALGRRLCDELADMERLYAEPCRDLGALDKRDALIEEHIEVLKNIVKNVPIHRAHKLGDDLRAAVALLQRFVDEPYPESVGFKMKKPPSFCLEAVQILKLLSDQMTPEDREAFRARQPSLIAHLIEEGRSE
jgi:hypothetical protein